MAKVKVSRTAYGDLMLDVYTDKYETKGWVALSKKDAEELAKAIQTELQDMRITQDRSKPQFNDPLCCPNCTLPLLNSEENPCMSCGHLREK